MSSQAETLVAVADTQQRVAVVFSHHARERYVQRVSPGINVDAALRVIERLSALAAITADPPAWHRTRRRAPMYLTLGDVAFALAPDRSEPERLVATTCMTRVPACRVPKHALGGVAFRGHARTRWPYRRPSPNRLAYLPARED